MYLKTVNLLLFLLLFVGCDSNKLKFQDCLIKYYNRFDYNYEVTEDNWEIHKFIAKEEAGTIPYKPVRIIWIKNFKTSDLAVNYFIQKFQGGKFSLILYDTFIIVCKHVIEIDKILYFAKKTISPTKKIFPISICMGSSFGYEY